MMDMDSFVTSAIVSALEDLDFPDDALDPLPNDQPVVVALKGRMANRERQRWDLAGQAADDVLARARLPRD